MNKSVLRDEAAGLFAHAAKSARRSYPEIGAKLTRHVYLLPDPVRTVQVVDKAEIKAWVSDLQLFDGTEVIFVRVLNRRHMHKIDWAQQTGQMCSQVGSRRS